LVLVLAAILPVTGWSSFRLAGLVSLVVGCSSAVACCSVCLAWLLLAARFGLLHYCCLVVGLLPPPGYCSQLGSSLARHRWFRPGCRLSFQYGFGCHWFAGSVAVAAGTGSLVVWLVVGLSFNASALKRASHPRG
jgi:hypothetical protein